MFATSVGLEYDYQFTRGGSTRPTIQDLIPKIALSVYTRTLIILCVLGSHLCFNSPDMCDAFETRYGVSRHPANFSPMCFIICWPAIRANWLCDGELVFICFNASNSLLATSINPKKLVITFRSTVLHPTLAISGRSGLCPSSSLGDTQTTFHVLFEMAGRCRIHPSPL